MNLKTRLIIYFKIRIWKYIKKIFSSFFKINNNIFKNNNKQIIKIVILHMYRKSAPIFSQS